MSINSDSSCNKKQPIILYIIVAIILAASLILCVRWLKSRSYSYTQTETQVVGISQDQVGASDVPRQSEQATQDVPNEDESGTEVINNSDNSSEESASASISMPSTGAEQTIPSALAMGFLVFVFQLYAKSRRKLHSCKTTL